MDIAARVEAAQFHYLLANSTTPLLGSAAGSLLVAAVQFESAPRPLLFGWLTLVYGMLVIRILLTYYCKQRLKRHGYHRPHAYRYAFTTALSGIAWGLGGLLIVDSTPIGQVVTITAILAMVMGGVMTLGAFLPSFFAFSLPSILPVILVLLWIGGTASLVLALYNTIFFLLMVAIALRFNRSLRQTWRLGFEKEDLVAALTEARDQLDLLAHTDGLTGVANRRQFDTQLEIEFLRMQRSGAPLSILFLDVDHFKIYNDTYGHIAGDQCLKQIAEVAQRHFNRRADQIARYGGEEFAGILPDTAAEGALNLAEQIRVEIAALAIPHRASPTADRVTVSLGVVTFLDCSLIASAEATLPFADEQLYRAKSEGRNRVAATIR